MTAGILGMPALAPRGVGHLRGDEPFPDAAREALADTAAAPQPRHATAHHPGQAGRGGRRGARLGGAARGRPAAQGRTPWPASTSYLVQLEAAVTARGGVVHWARDADEANRIVTDLVRATGADEVVKVKSMATQEIGLNEALEAAGHRGAARPTSPS